MSEIEIYAFEDEDGETVTEWTTTDINEAREYAHTHQCALVARTYEYTDTELVEDYRVGHLRDGSLDE